MDIVAYVSESKCYLLAPIFLLLGLLGIMDVLPLGQLAIALFTSFGIIIAIIGEKPSLSSFQKSI